MDIVNTLRARAAMLQTARSFFSQRNITEVDCPLITSKASVDPHIDLIPTFHPSGNRYLHSSPEYGMKRLLSLGIGDIYQLAHVFRQEEVGRKHNPEFMMAEWYRLGFSFEEMIEETLQFCQLFVDAPFEILSYRDAFKLYTNIDPFTATKEDLENYIVSNNLPIYSGAKEEGKDALLNLILALEIEENLGKNRFCALAYYPSSQAALAKTRLIDGALVAERFEVYYNGMELANGYHELIDPIEQEKRLHEANTHRKLLGKEELPIDDFFLKALKQGMPDCCGVAVGVDRLMMLKFNKSSISEVIPFGWDFA